MTSKLWHPIYEISNKIILPIIIVDEYGNYKYYEEINIETTYELINDGYIKWCYLADMVQAAYEM